ncbi:hypothetical protein IscW_ISCW005716 [Ixodes scapularis]|uniref:Uncharacterized protein n=1 Tax=Ixodes scapularis TaxID=6945 RepID=B7PKU5_IXOSC|nr:hypothetical protein IscW_ISCW005716 [Ixodes scapularis]|eukprot:XP_002434393.1 hypothetical protein IscW_ISCW005716 [Ixodes scapularis]
MRANITTRVRATQTAETSASDSSGGDRGGAWCTSWSGALAAGTAWGLGVPGVPPGDSSFVAQVAFQ